MISKDDRVIGGCTVESTPLRGRSIILIQVESITSRRMFEMHRMQHRVLKMQQLFFGRRNHHCDVAQGMPWCRDDMYAGHNLLFALKQFDATFERRQVLLRRGDKPP